MLNAFRFSVAAMSFLGLCGPASAEDDNRAAGRDRNDELSARQACTGLPAFDELRQALAGANAEPGGLQLQRGPNNVWATVVSRDGVVCAVAFSGASRADQWPGSRVISAQKANTANAFSLPQFALSTANLYAAVQPGGSLFGLQESNPVSTRAAYAGDPANYGTAGDPLIGLRIGGVNVFGGGLALYRATGELIGGIGVSGDTSCRDHRVAWVMRHALRLDAVPAGVSGDIARPDNIILDIEQGNAAASALATEGGRFLSPSGFGHPGCGDRLGEIALVAKLPTTTPAIRQTAAAAK